MEPCPTCAEPLTKSQRFCPSCRAAAQDVELLDAGAAPLFNEQTVTRESRFDNRWYVALGALLTVAIGWSIFSSPGTEDATSNGDTDVADSTTTTIAETATSDIEAPEETSTTSGDEEDVDGEGAGFGSDRVSVVDQSDASIAVVGGPLGDSGLTLVAGKPIRFLDLDTGEVTETTHRNLIPIAVIGDRLVVNSESSGNNLKALDLNDLEADPEDFESPNGYLFAFSVGQDPNTIVAIADNYSSGPSLSRYVYDAATGTIIDETSVEIDLSFFGGLVGVGDFMSPRAGGVYRIVGSGHELVGPGRVVAQGDGLVLVQECDAQLECNVSWRDSATYETTELPLPDSIADGQIIANGRLLVFRSTDRWESSILDLETGELIATTVEDLSSWTTAVSPNNEMIAFVSDGALTLKDLETGAEHGISFTNNNSSVFPGLVLIETP